MTLTAEQIEAARDFQISDPIPVPEWAPAGSDPAEAFVFVRSLTAGDRDRFVQRCIDEKTGSVRSNVDNVTATLLAMTLCNEAGEPLFPDLAAGKRILALKSAKACDAPFTAAMELNALRSDDIEEITKN